MNLYFISSSLSTQINNRVVNTSILSTVRAHNRGEALEFVINDEKSLVKSYLDSGYQDSHIIQEVTIKDLKNYIKLIKE